MNQAARGLHPSSRSSFILHPSSFILAMTALGTALHHLPWLSPCAASLVALARPPSSATWAAVRSDPGAVLLVARATPSGFSPHGPPFPAHHLEDPAVCESALRLLAGADAGPAAGFVDWTRPELQPVYQAAVSTAHLAAYLAGRTRRGDPERAWATGLLAPLGWLAVCAADPARAVACLHDPALKKHPFETQKRHWGLDQEALTRRLARRWQLPDELASVLAHLSLPAEPAQGLGADRELFRVVRLAVGTAQRHGFDLGLLGGASSAFDVEEACAGLGLAAGDAQRLQLEAEKLRANPPAPEGWTSPAGVPLLRELLRLAAENRRSRDRPLWERLEGELDGLHRLLAEQHASEAERLKAQKLRALAEFASGAGHEINNPLAVISGQAQYLLGQETDPARQKALRTIIAQTQRVHQILRELMQFARPPRPQKAAVDLPGLVREVAASLGEQAAQANVHLACADAEPIRVHADPDQMRTALTCLVRNAVEAAAASGHADAWAGVRLDTSVPDQVDVIVENSGAGPDLPQREHLFDPFYSGRAAGRGRGLGLPTAWRLAREQGGDVHFAGVTAGRTRFVMSLPREAAAEQGVQVNGNGLARV
jgi:signal transduction histidine kinase